MKWRRIASSAGCCLGRVSRQSQWNEIVYEGVFNEVYIFLSGPSIKHGRPDAGCCLGRVSRQSQWDKIVYEKTLLY